MKYARNEEESRSVIKDLVDSVLANPEASRAAFAIT
jgi:hypothetical protein